MMETPGGSRGRLIEVDAGAVVVQGYLNIPESAQGIVVFAQASENIQYDYVAQLLRSGRPDRGALATLVVNLLTPEDQALDRETGFFHENVDVLHQRIVGIANTLIENPETQSLRIFYFGTGPSGAAALIAAAVRPDAVVAVISANGRLDLAKEYLSQIKAPTLLIVGGKDTSAVNMNQEALNSISAKKKLETIPGATNLFENTNTQEEVARMAGQWLAQYLG